MPHTVESTITYSAADYARGAVDLINDEPPVLSNTTAVEKAATLVREMAPTVIETIVSHLVPVSPSSPQQQHQPPQQHQTFISPPVETVLIVEVPSNSSATTPIHPADTVCSDKQKNSLGTIIFILISFIASFG
jgi:hypothetical protein